MGLDVYLYRSDDWPAAIAAENAYDAESEALYEEFPYSDVDEHKVERDAARKALEAKYDIKGYRPSSIEGQEQPSAIHPDHLFKVGYWRSSYNSGGINSVLRDAIGKDLHYIADIEHDPEDHYSVIDWAGVKTRVAEVRDEFRAWVEKNGVVRASCEDVHDGYGHTALPTSEAEAVAAYLAEREEWLERDADYDGPEDFRFTSYSGAKGSFFQVKPKKLVAAIPGKDILGRPCIYNIVLGEDDDLTFYFEALDIVEETADYVLANDPSQFRVVWSG